MKLCSQRSWQDTLKGVEGKATHSLMHMQHRAQMRARMIKSCSQRSCHDTLKAARGNATHALVHIQHHAQMRARMMKNKQPAELA